VLVLVAGQFCSGSRFKIGFDRHAHADHVTGMSVSGSFRWPQLGGGKLPFGRSVSQEKEIFGYIWSFLSKKS
jgi:hypothetical protein